MPYKTILVHAEADPATASRIEVAAALARRFDATLVGLGAEMFDWVGVSDPYGIQADAWLTIMREQMDQNLRAAEALFRTHAAGAEHRWETVIDLPAPAMARLSRSADLIVTSSRPTGHATARRTANAAELAMMSGRPVLAAPPGDGHLSARNIVVAWKDSREARRAIIDALPFLIQAEEVVVMEVCDADQTAEALARATEVAEHLGRHGAKARPLVRTGASESAPTLLNIEAQAIGADLIVCGAFGHGRLQEWVLGGVTHDFLHAPERFVLFSH